MENIKNSLPEYAKDTKINLSVVLTEEGAPDLTQKQINMVALSSAFTCKNKQLIAGLLVDVGDKLTHAEIEASKGATVIMAMNNIYYRFIHLAQDKSYASMPAKLRMNIIANPGVDKVDFELCSLAVSAINGCGMCMDAHAMALEKAQVSKLGIQSAIRIASVIHAAALALELETV